jgi:hypothetical protein
MILVNLQNNFGQRTPCYDVACDRYVTEGMFSARQDTQHSNAGNVPLDETKKTWQGRGRSSGRSGLCVLAAVNWYATAMCFFGVFFSTPKSMARSFLAHYVRFILPIAILIIISNCSDYIQ